jgi:hypothetical protein
MFALLVLASCDGCDKNSAATGASDAPFEAVIAPSRPADVQRLWDDAMGGGEDELLRLANAEGPAGLEERAVDPRLRPTALSAMGYTRTLEGLALLGESAAGDPEPLATIAVRSAEMIASNPRRSRDPEDALEVRQGCDRLRAARADPARPKSVKDGAERTLAMLAELCGK